MNKIEHPSSNHVTFNLAEHLPKQLNSSAPRFRISEMKVLLMDKNENILYHGSTFSTNDVVVQITFPKIFSDHTIYGKKIHFGVSKAYHCQSAYFNKSMESYLSTNFFSLLYTHFVLIRWHCLLYRNLWYSCWLLKRCLPTHTWWNLWFAVQ